jgi:hypothetical protein
VSGGHCYHAAGWLSLSPSLSPNPGEKKAAMQGQLNTAVQCRAREVREKIGWPGCQGLPGSFPPTP